MPYLLKIQLSTRQGNLADKCTLTIRMFNPMDAMTTASQREITSEGTKSFNVDHDIPTSTSRSQERQRVEVWENTGPQILLSLLDVSGFGTSTDLSNI